MVFLSKKYTALFILILGFSLLVMKAVFDNQVKVMIGREYSSYDVHMTQSIDAMVNEKKDLTEALAITFSSSVKWGKLLQKKPVYIQSNLNYFTKKLKENSSYKQIWVQLLNNKGISLGRSWSDKSGDDLTKVRLDVASVVQKPRKLSSFSVGKFTLSFKTLVPIYDKNNKFIGILDFITKVSSIDKKIKEAFGARSVVLVHDSYKAQLTKADKKRFIGDFFIANEGVVKKDIDLISKIGIDKIFSNTDYRALNDEFIHDNVILDIQGKPMALWLTISPIDSLDFKHVTKLKVHLISIFVFIFVLLILLIMLFSSHHKSNREKKFFYQFFGKSTEEIVVFDNEFIIEANQRFLKLFFKSKLPTVSLFNKKFSCIFDIFVAEQFENGVRDNKALLNRLLKNEEGETLKIESVNGPQTFIVKATKIESKQGGENTVLLMTNISKEVLYLEKLEKLIVTDELTGIKNRHYFNDKLSEDIKFAIRYEEPLSLVMIDIDFFKNINDEFGHDVGDLTLTKVSTVMEKCLRETDRLCRIGGEEFAVIMTKTDIEGALIIAERLREEVQQISTKHIPKKITISLGVTELKQWDSFHSIYKRSDEALYYAKNRGRNRVAILANESEKNSGEDTKEMAKKTTKDTTKKTKNNNKKETK